MGTSKEITEFYSPNGVKFEKKSYNDLTYHRTEAFFMSVQDDFDEDYYTEISKEFYEAATKEFLNNTLFEEAKKAIRRIDAGPYQHNIISMILQDLRNKTGTKDYSNRVIDELGLDFEKA